ncbi:uncharacterized protein LOC111875571 [Cryptotermes secundus]|uniref:uncharacterized protein LOC111875571 n=1 Tax=Cryptotermes secundus TaxID=105785 RepID=UPI000CD7B939|nr:uncharacterized protein LOC111875571 [Cryptotermes secundus]
MMYPLPQMTKAEHMKGPLQMVPSLRIRRKIKQVTHTHTNSNIYINNMKFLQINIHHSKAVMATLSQQLAEGKAEIALIQEPWLYKGQIRGLTNTGGTVYSAVPGNNARSCVYIRNHINALPLLELCSRDATVVRTIYKYRGGSRELIVASVYSYLPYDSDEPPPTKEMRDIVDYCYSRKKQLIIGCDANAHHILWGSTGTNPRGESLRNFWKEYKSQVFETEFKKNM